MVCHYKLKRWLPACHAYYSAFQFFRFLFREAKESVFCFWLGCSRLNVASDKLCGRSVQSFTARFLTLYWLYLRPQTRVVYCYWGEKDWTLSSVSTICNFGSHRSLLKTVVTKVVVWWCCNVAWDHGIFFFGSSLNSHHWGWKSVWLSTEMFMDEVMY